MSDKKKYRVLCTMTTDLYLDVEAESRDEAIEIAELTDGGEFMGYTGYGVGGDWDIYDAYELKEQTDETEHNPS